jgi:exosortase/archaeosortase family protein
MKSDGVGGRAEYQNTVTIIKSMEQKNLLKGLDRTEPVSHSGKSFALWLTAFLTLSAVFYWIDSSYWFQSFLLQPYTIYLAGLAASLLNLLGMHVQQVGPILSAGTINFEFAGSCTASFVFMMYAAAVLPFPVAWRSRMKGILLGVVVIFALNLARGVLIVFVAARFPATLWSLHIIIGQILVVGGVLALFIGWVRQAERGAHLIRLPLSRPSLQGIYGFAAAYLLGSLFYYNLFIQSGFAGWIRELIVRHSAAALSLFMPAASSGKLLVTPARSLELLPACLNSPVIVIVMAVAAAWPTRWWKKSLLIAGGFLPLFYLFNLIRVCSIVISSPLDTAGEHSFMHTYFGPLTLIGLLISLGGYEMSLRRRTLSLGRYLAWLVAGLLAAIVLAGLCNLLYRQLLLPSVLQLIQGYPELRYDPEQTLSRIAGVQAFIWILAVSLAPILAIRRKIVAAELGLAGFLFFSVAFAAFCAIFHLAPHIRLIKAVTLALPIIASLPMFLRKMP